MFLLIVFLLGMEALPLILFSCLLFLVVRKYHHLHQIALSIPWWGPLAVTAALFVLVWLIHSIIPNKHDHSGSEELGGWIAIHSLWYNYAIFFCAKDGILLPVIALPLTLIGCFVLMLWVMMIGVNIVSILRGRRLSESA